MGMRVGGTSSAWSGAGTSGVQQRQQGIKDLFAALSSGDLQGAQQAFAAVAKVSKIDGHSALGQLGQALQQGDLAGAEKLAATMQARTAAAPAQARPSLSPLTALRGQGAAVNLLV